MENCELLHIVTCMDHGRDSLKLRYMTKRKMLKKQLNSRLFSESCEPQTKGELAMKNEFKMVLMSVLIVAVALLGFTGCKHDGEHPTGEHPSKKTSSGEHPTSEHPTKEVSSEEKSAEEHPTAEKSADEHPTEEKPAEEHPTEEKSADEHPTKESSSKEHPASEHPAGEHPK